MRIRFFIQILFIVLAFGTSSCTLSSNKKLNKRITLWRKDKIPYGTWFAYEHLNAIFPEADVEINKKSPDKSKNFKLTDASTYITEVDTADNHKKLFLVISHAVIPDAGEIAALRNMINEGEQIFISANLFGEVLCDSMHIKTASQWVDTVANFYNSVSLLHPVLYDTSSFTYPGFEMSNYFEKLDSVHTTILGYNADGRANFIKISYTSGGSIYLHAAPIAFTNFFLLHKQNSAYYDQVFSYLPNNISTIFWDDYFRNVNRSSDFSALSVVMANKSLRWAFYVILLLFALLILSEVNRRQKVVPVISPLSNSSLDFVKTVGRLYFQRKDNQDLALKMAAHFKEFVRSRHNISTVSLDDEFIKKLAYKTDYDIKELHQLVYSVKMAEDYENMDDTSLMNFNHQLQKFYKNNN